MAERFERLFELPNNLYSEGSSVIISSGALLKDRESGSIIVQLKFQSVSPAAIKAVSIDISAFDVTGREIAGKKNYQYLDLSVSEGNFFGNNKAIIMPDPTTRSFAITNMCVVFSDGSTKLVQFPLSALPESIPLRQGLVECELEKQYRLMVNDSAQNVPLEACDLWKCSCGMWNKNTSCSRCHASKEVVFSSLNNDLLRERAEIRIAEAIEKERELAEIENAEAERRNEEAKLLEQKANEQKKRKHRISIIASAASIVLIIAIIVSINYFKQKQETTALDNIARASVYLGQIAEGGSITLSSDDYNFITNTVEIMGFHGRFVHGYSYQKGQIIVDMMDWISEDAIEDDSKVLDFLIEEYGTDYRIQFYNDPQCDAYMWKNVGQYEYVCYWKNSDGTIDIRWTISTD